MPSRLDVRFSDFGGDRRTVTPRVTTVCCYPLGPGRVMPCRRLTTWALEAHTRAAGRVFFTRRSGASLLREAGTIHLYAPGCVYGEDSRGAAPDAQETYWLFEGGRASGLERFVDNPRRFARFFDPEQLVSSLLVESARICRDRGGRSFWKVQSLLATALDYLLESRTDGDPAPRITSALPQPGFALRVEHYLRTHFPEPVTLADLARHLRVSPSVVSHTFKAETGVAPIARLIQIRIEHAKSLLRKGERLKPIAAATGHSSEFHLSRNFKSVTGLSPARYRALHGARHG